MRRFMMGVAAMAIVVPALQLAAQKRDHERERPAAAAPKSVAREMLDIYNAPGTRRETGAVTIEEDEDVRGDVAVTGGPLTVRGHVRGRVVAINASVRLVHGSRIGGDVLVTGGGLEGRAAGYVGGDVRVYRDAIAYHHEGSELVADAGTDREREWADRGRDRNRDDTDDRDTAEWWQRLRTTEHGSASMLLTAAKTYSRVEGLPIMFGPTVRHDFGAGRVSLDAFGIFRTTQGWNWNPQTVGYKSRLEMRFGRRWGVAFGGKAYDQVDGVETWQMSDLETGLGAFLFQKDFRDYYGRQGGEGFVRLIGGDAELKAGYAHERWKNMPATNVFALIRGNGWRGLPTMDEGDMHLSTASLTYDTRNDVEDPSNGWWIQADYERGDGTLARLSGYALPPAGGVVPAPIAYQRGFIDFRRYTRVGPDAQVNFRVVGGGRLPGSDPLPEQRLLSVSGPGGVPGFAFREFDYAAGGLNTGECSSAAIYGSPAQCERIALAQVEFRGSLNFNFFQDVLDRYEPGPRRSANPPRPGRWGSRTRSGSWVLFADAGRGWLVGAPGDGMHYTGGDLPKFDTFRTDVGVGLDFDPLGIYYAKAMSDQSRPGVIFLRVHHRF